VGILLLVIIAALTGLTLRFHKGMRLAEARLSQAEARGHRIEEGMAVFGENVGKLLPRLPREDLARTAVTLDGEGAHVLELPAAMGEAIGLHVGDIVRVYGPADATTRPAPSTRRTRDGRQKQ